MRIAGKAWPCWQLVRASEATGMPCMILENGCYSLEEMPLLNMVKQGLFGGRRGA